MGMDCYSKSGLGIIVPFNKFVINKKEKTFSHSYPQDWEVDPKTGKKLWKEELYYNPIIFPDWADCEYEGLYDSSIGEYPLVPLEDDNILVCLDSAVTSSHRSSYGNNTAHSKIDPQIFMKRFKKFKLCMEEKGLWNDSFGLYSYLKISV